VKIVGSYFGQVKQFVLGVRQEFSKVVWPTKVELFGIAGMVLVVVAAFSLYLGFLDLLIGHIARRVLAL
jgi:preprotein translocase SecE subunit